MTVHVVDYGGGNIRSVCNALEFLGAKYCISSDPRVIESAKKLIFPGVGSFGSVMESLRERNLDIAIINAINNKARFFGICVGMQVLFSESEESRGITGLEVFDGKVIRFDKGKVPEIGWNKIESVKESIFQDNYVYFVNSYYPVPADENIIACTSEYTGSTFCSAISFENIFATQFHPEKSGKVGLDILKRWLYDL